MDSQVEFLQVTIFLSIYIILYRYFHHFYNYLYILYADGDGLGSHFETTRTGISC